MGIITISPLSMLLCLQLPGRPDLELTDSSSIAVLRYTVP